MKNLRTIIQLMLATKNRKATQLEEIQMKAAFSSLQADLYGQVTSAEDEAEAVLSGEAPDFTEWSAEELKVLFVMASTGCITALGSAV